MIIQHNIPAINSHRNLGINNSATAKNLEKLSSGYRINRAGDDAAGLAISEKMRGQIRGLAMAEQNTQNGISLIQTAEGGLNETHAILQRMRELAVQASNGTYQNEDREQIDLEFDNLKKEITRIAESTHYNGIKLLDGNLDASSVVGNITADADSIVSKVKLDSATTVGTTFKLDNLVYDSVQSFVIALPGASGHDAADEYDFTVSFNGGAYTLSEVDVAVAGSNDADVWTELVAKLNADTNFNADYTASLDGNGNLVIELTATSSGNLSDLADFDVTIGPGTTNGGSNSGSFAVSTGDFTGGTVQTVGTLEIDINGTTYKSSNPGNEITYANGVFTVTDSAKNVFTLSEAAIVATLDPVLQTTTTSADITAATGTGLVFQIGANGGQDQRVDMTISRMAADVLGLEVGKIMSDGVTQATATDADVVNNADVKNVANANRAIEIIHAATNQVSAQRAELGALQNRLEHTLNNLGVTKENLTAAESVIRDVDMAKEMMEFTKNNILVQASQAMLAQATQLPQGVLQLLR